MARGKQDNAALLRALELVRPAGLSNNHWLKLASLNPSFFTGLKQGVEPGVYILERLVGAVGVDLPTFWRLVEAERR